MDELVTKIGYVAVILLLFFLWGYHSKHETISAQNTPQIYEVKH
jgi:hypothetical protein